MQHQLRTGVVVQWGGKNMEIMKVAWRSKEVGTCKALTAERLGPRVAENRPEYARALLGK